MSLVTKIWISIWLVVIIIITGSVIISTHTSKQYFEEQLFAKNMDNASMLALAISSLDKTPVNIEMFIGSQFDIGHYSSISLVGPNGKVIAQQTATRRLSTPIPEWFINLLQPQVSPGVAQVADGWSQYGSLYVQTDTSIAIEGMWLGMQRLVTALLIVGVVCGVVGSLLMRVILMPLKHVVKQAESLGKMQFVQLPLPSTKELRKVVQAMNGLSIKFKRILNDENQRLDIIRGTTHFDDETLLANREYFLSILAAQLSFRDTEGNNCLVLLSIQDFKTQAVKLAPNQMTKFAISLANTIKKTTEDQRLRYSDVRLGRISEPDFAILITEVHQLSVIVEDLNNSIEQLVATKKLYKGIKVNIAAVQLKADESAKDSLGRADQGILTAISEYQLSPSIILADRPESPEDESHWRELLTQCINDGAVKTLNYPVVNFDSETIHYQAWAAIELSGSLHKSGYYTHWARYLNLLAQLELQVVKYLLKVIQKQNDGKYYAVLVSESFILDTQVLDQLFDLLIKHAEISKFIHFEVRESTVADNPKPFREFCQIVKSFDSQIGLKRVGESFSELIDIQELGLDYVKIDSAFIHDIHKHKASQAYIRSFTSLAHSFDIKVYADGVNSIKDSQTIRLLGLDGEISNYQLET